MTTQTDTTAWRFPSNDNGQIFGIADSTITAELVRELSKYLNVLGGTYLLDCLSPEKIMLKVTEKGRELAEGN